MIFFWATITKNECDLVGTRCEFLLSRRFNWGCGVIISGPFPLFELYRGFWLSCFGFEKFFGTAHVLNVIKTGSDGLGDPEDEGISVLGKG
jgi:hypothetical protein